MYPALYNSGRNGQPMATKQVNQIIPCANPAASTGLVQKWLILKLTNTTVDNKNVALFDASGNFELNDGIITQDGVTIEGISENYQSVLNNLASGVQFCVSLTRMEIIAGDNSQFDQPWGIKDYVPFTKGSNLLQTIYPSTGLDPYQQQANRVDVRDPYSITRNRLMDFILQGETTIVLRMQIGVLLNNG